MREQEDVMVNLILCGGSGTRLWPLSRKMFPKQFVRLIDGKSLFQGTVGRNAVLADSFCIVTNRDHYFIAEHQMEEVVPDKNTAYILEPMGRNTAPAIALACFHYDPEELLFVTPSDHLIDDGKSYADRVAKAVEVARRGFIVTFGIKPEYPETGYGYIETDSGDEKKDAEVFKVTTFREKPDRATAEHYVKAGNYYWNSGMFLFKAGVYLDELKKYSPEIYETSLAAYQQSGKVKDSAIIDKILPSDEQMAKIPADSIDYAVMEKSDLVYVVPSRIGWNDLGSFDSLVGIIPHDADGNTRDDNVLSIESKNNLVFSDTRKVALVGIDNIVVVDTDDALLIAKKGESQKVKDVVAVLQKGSDRDKDLALFHSTVHRPWGSYSVLEERPGYKIKKIEVKTGKRLSLQKHLHRSEHWVVVSGTAIVQIGKEEKIVRKNESTYIPIGEMHRLSNCGKINLVIIETQVGEYLGEDDIIRVEDDFKRCE